MAIQTPAEWLGKSGRTYTTDQVVDLLRVAMGSSITAEMLEKTYPVGRFIDNGGVWFQRIA